MKPTLPFASLRVFEAVVRLGGFRRAAEDLGMTQSAVSQHVRRLEEWLGRTLLIRGPRNSTPTAEGLRLNEAVTSGLDLITEACTAIKDKSSRNAQPLMISTLPGFALKWLFPRLIRFDQNHPDIPISIITEATPADFTNDQVTLAIRYGLGRYRGLHVERLFGETLFPVCAPSLLERGPPLKQVSDLARHTILMDDVAKIRGKGPGWESWLKAAGIDLDIEVNARRFGQANMVVQAAVEGLGVALGREPLVVGELSAGRLVRPFAVTAPSEFAYYLVCPEDRLKEPRVAAFRDWLMVEAERMQTLV